MKIKITMAVNIEWPQSTVYNSQKIAMIAEHAINTELWKDIGNEPDRVKVEVISIEGK